MIVLIGSLAALLFFGIPIAFAIGFSTLAFLTLTEAAPLTIIAQRMTAGVDSFPLLALPLFLLAGALMDKGGATPRLMRLANALVGHVSGGMAVVTVVASMFFGAISGSGVASTAAIGSIMLPEMVRRGYGKGFITSLTAGAGVLGIIIPPSLPMVVLGVAGNVSIAAMLIGGIIPGTVMGVSLIILSVVISRRRGYDIGKQKASLKEIVEAFHGALLPLLTPVIILGGIMSGVFTPTESAVVGVVYALLLGLFVFREMGLKDLTEVFSASAVSSAVIMFIVSVAAAFAWVMAQQGIPVQMAQIFMEITKSPIVLLILINVLLLILGTFMETIAIIIILAPILVPVVIKFGVDPVHFGVMVIANLAIGGVTPPLGVALITAARILKIRLEDTFPEVVYVVGAMTLALVVIMVFPGVVLWIPQHFLK